MPSAAPERFLIVAGIVRDGDKRARGLGFPTANLYEAGAAGSDGVYAGFVKIEDSVDWRVAVISVGRRPTYYGGVGVRLLEAHILDWSGDLYGKHISIALCAHLRSQREFASSVALIDQIRSDVTSVRQWATENGVRLSQRRRGGAPSGRWLVGREQGRPWSDRTLWRHHKRAASLQQALVETPPGHVSHEDVARRARVPVGYLRWLHPDVSSLAIAVASARAAASGGGQKVTRADR